jgi:hypothetical protein
MKETPEYIYRLMTWAVDIIAPLGGYNRGVEFEITSGGSDLRLRVCLSNVCYTWVKGDEVAVQDYMQNLTQTGSHLRDVEYLSPHVIDKAKESGWRLAGIGRHGEVSYRNALFLREATSVSLQSITVGTYGFMWNDLRHKETYHTVASSPVTFLFGNVLRLTKWRPGVIIEFKFEEDDHLFYLTNSRGVWVLVRKGAGNKITPEIKQPNLATFCAYIQDKIVPHTGARIEYLRTNGGIS